MYAGRIHSARVYQRWRCRSGGRRRLRSEDGDDIREVQGHGSHREDSIDGDGTREIEQTREEREHGHQPNGTERGPCPGVDVTKETAVGEAVVATEGIHGTGDRLEGGLAHEERREAHEHPDEERSGIADTEDQDLLEFRVR